MTDDATRPTFETQPIPPEAMEEVHKAALAYFTALFENRCPVCGEPVKKQKKVGRCVFAQPCGHRMYQGQPGAFSK